MSRKIAIIELYQHNEVLSHYCNLLNSDKYSIEAYCKKSLFEQLHPDLKSQSIKWTCQDSEESIHKFIKKHERGILENELIIITTAFDSFNAFRKIAEKANTVLILHSSRSWLEPFKHINLKNGQKMLDFLRLLKFAILQYPFRQRLLNSVNYIALPNQSILAYVNEKIKASKQYKLISLPFNAYLERSKLPVKTANCTFTISGALKDEVRDYEQIIATIQLLKTKLSTPIEFIFLGTAGNKYGSLIKRRLESLSDEIVKIKTYHEFIPQSEFDHVLQNTDFIILPLKKITPFYVFKELTCLTKLSGSVNDMIRFGIPAIVSEHFSFNNEIDQSVTYYKNEFQLAEIIEQISRKSNRIKLLNEYRGQSYSTLLNEFENHEFFDSQE